MPDATTTAERLPTVMRVPKIMKAPTFMRPRRAAIPKPAPKKAEKLKSTEVLPTEIQGKPVGSTNEAHVALALDYMQIRYGYQVPVDYGRQRVGGQVLDFVTYSLQPYTVVDVRGVYWHTGRHEDSFSIEKVVKKKGWNLVVIWDFECNSTDQAITILRQRLPHG